MQPDATDAVTYPYPNTFLLKQIEQLQLFYALP